jgi:2-isopropylmalate synthase
MNHPIVLADATLEHAERTPGCSLNLEERLRLAHQLERLSPDIIDAGSPMTSPLDFEAVRLIARSVEQCIVSARCHPRKSEIDRAWEALQSAKKARIHLVTADFATPEHDPASPGPIAALAEAVQYALTLCQDVEVTVVNAPYLSQETLKQIVSAASAAGAGVLCLADDAGYATPEEYGSMFSTILAGHPSESPPVLGAACANDLGLALANALSALRNGARQIECTVNGLGPRAGVVPLEEFAVLLQVRPGILSSPSGVKTEEISKTSRLLGSLTGMSPQRNKPIVGTNAFADQQTPRVSPGAVIQPPYQPVTPASVGIRHSTKLLGKHSDATDLARRYKELGYDLSQDELEHTLGLFRQIAEQKREVHDEDLLAILEQHVQDPEEIYHLENLQVHSGTMLRPTATVELRKGSERYVDSATGDGPVDAAYKAIERITGVSGRLTEYLIKSVSLGRDGFGEVFVRLDFDGVSFHGRGVSTDVITGSVRAYLEALNRSIAARKKRGPVVP